MNKIAQKNNSAITHKLKKMKNDWLFYVLFIPTLLWIFFFRLRPLPGIVLAWKDFSYADGIWGSEWVGWQWFKEFFSDPEALHVLWNTVLLGLMYIISNLIASVAIALFLNELRMNHAKKLIQTAVTLPYFISWVVMAGMFGVMFSSTGPINSLLASLGMDLFTPQIEPGIFRWYLIFTAICKGAGWGSIIYLAGVTSIDQTQYESATLDGASRLKQIWYITLPGIKSLIITQMILAVGNIVINGHFDQIYNMYSIPVYEVADTLDTYIFRETLLQGGMDFGYSTAIGLIKQVIGLIMITVANKIAKSAGERGIM